MFEVFEITIWYIAVGICFLLMVMFLLQYKRRSSLSRPFFLGLSIFMLSYGIARLIENIRRYSIGTYNDIFNAWIAGSQIEGLNFWLRFLYYLIAWIGIAIMYFNIEKYIFKQNKFALTICSIIEGTVSIVNYFLFNPITFWFSVVFFFIAGYFIPLMFLNLARKTPAGKVRNGCIMIGIGILLFVTSVMLDLPETAYFMYILQQENPEAIIRILSPIMMICGLFVFSIGFRRFFPKE